MTLNRFRMSRRKRNFLGGTAVLLIAAGAAGAVVLVGASPTRPTPPPTVVVNIADITRSVSGKGTIDAARTASAAFIDSGTVTSIQVAVGQPVTAGQDIATMDNAAANRALDKAHDARKAALSALDAAKSQRTNVQSAVDAARTAQSTAESAAKLAAATPRTEGDLPPAVAPDPTTVAAAVREASAQIPASDAVITQATVQLADADRDVAAAEAGVAATTLTAPIDGVVTAINGTIGSVTGGGGSQSSTSPAGAGSATGAGTGLIQISDVSVLRVTALVSEADISTVTVGQKTTVSIAANSGVATTGTVVSIAPTPMNTDGIVRFPVTIELTDPSPEVRLGLTAVATIITGQADKVLALPLDAVDLQTPTTGTVTVPGKGKRPAKTVDVTLGIVGADSVEVTGGLRSGDTVLLHEVPESGPPTEPSGGGSSNVTSVGGGQL